MKNESAIVRFTFELNITAEEADELFTNGELGHDYREAIYDKSGNDMVTAIMDIELLNDKV